MLAGFTGLECRLVNLQIIRHEELRKKAEAFTEFTRIMPPWRGEIRDRKGRTIAGSSPVVTVYADTILCSNRVAEVAHQIAPLIQVEEKEIARRLHSSLLFGGNGTALKAVVLKRSFSIEQWNAVTNALARASFGMNLKSLTKSEAVQLVRLQRKALFAQEEQLRTYPYADSISQVVGFVSRESDRGWPCGVFGVEGALNEVLTGVPGICVSQQDAAGRELPFRRRHFIPSIPGDHVTLTIDLEIQQIVEAALAEAIRVVHPKNANVIVMRPRTSEILAWVCWPPLVPEDTSGQSPQSWRNHSLGDKFEPGSTFKIVVLSAALNEGLVTLDDWIFCENGRFATKGVVIRDHASYGWLTIRQAVAKSSNIAFAKIALMLGAERLHRYIMDFGFGRLTRVPLIGETPGYVPSIGASMATPVLTRLGFGQGLGASQLQMTLAMCAICNDGCLLRPMLVSRIETPQGKTVSSLRPEVVGSVLSPRAAQNVREALEAVVMDHGTGRLAAMKYHTSGGKTGTAQEANKHGYLPDQYYASFIGFFPVAEPEICISVAFDGPRNGHFGGSIAAPVFRVIAEQLAIYLGIPPDKGVSSLPRSNSDSPRSAGFDVIQPLSQRPAT